MPTPKKGARLGGSPAHQKLILSNLAKQLIEHRAVTTTEAKAKVLRPYMEKLITKAKRGDMHARRTVLKKVPSKDAVYTLFDEIVPAMDPERRGGYTRLVRVVMEKVEKKAVVSSAERTAAKAAERAAAAEVAKEAGEAAGAAAERAEEAREEGDAAKAEEAERIAVEAGTAADAAEQVAEEE